MSDLSLMRTEDGSPTLYSHSYGATYHSKHGAIQESQHVFIDAGLSTCTGKNPIRILEMGFGTGLNALLTALWVIGKNISVDYESLETIPLEPELIQPLSASIEDVLPGSQKTFRMIHEAPWNSRVEIEKDFSLFKRNEDLTETHLESGYDLVYFDAFAPGTQPELWTEGIFKRLFDAMAQGGIMTTYCSKGDVRRAMISVGFEVEKIPGPPGKREMLRAFKG